MKLKFALSLTVLLLSLLACQASDLPGYTVRGGTPTPGVKADTTQSQQLFAGSPLPKASQTPQVTPTPTVNYLEMYNAASTAEQYSKATAESANVIIVGYTAAQDARLSAEEIALQEAEKAKAEAQIVSVNATSSFVPTAIYLTGTARSEKSTAEINAQNAFEKAPTVITALTQANMTESTIQASNAARWAIAAFVGVMTIFIVMKLIALLMSGGNSLNSARADSSGNSDDGERNSAGEIPLEKDEDSLGDRMVRIYPDIPCPLPELIALANGILEGGKTLAFRDWSGTTVYKYLKDTRIFFKVNSLVEPLPGGELHMVKNGKEFLRDVRDNQSPPLPYRCAL